MDHNFPPFRTIKDNFLNITLSRIPETFSSCNKYYTTTFNDYDVDFKNNWIERATEATRMLEGRCRQISLQEVCAFVSFNTQMSSLWDVDLNLQNYNFIHLQETSVGAALVNTLITDIAEPKSFKDIASILDKIEWYDSVTLERTTFESRGTWILVK